MGFGVFCFLGGYCGGRGKVILLGLVLSFIGWGLTFVGFVLFLSGTSLSSSQSYLPSAPAHSDPRPVASVSLRPSLCNSTFARDPS